MFVAFVLAALAACEHQDAPAALAPPPPATSSKAPDTRATVTFGSAAMVHVEVVQRDAELQKGLMYREHLPPDDGMLFIMGHELDWKFWMHNTLIPLDIIFVKKDMTVAGVAADAKPKDDTQVGAGTGEMSLYVVEVNAGWCKAHGVAGGTKVSFGGVTVAP